LQQVGVEIRDERSPSRAAVPWKQAIFSASRLARHVHFPMRRLLVFANTLLTVAAAVEYRS